MISIRILLATMIVLLWQFNCFTPKCHAIGDVDGDGDVDNFDMAIILGNFGASIGIGTGIGISAFDGDVDSDGDVDEFDFLIAKPDFDGFGGGFISPISDPNPALLLYNPATGHLSVDATNAPGSTITNFILESGGSFLPGSATFPFSESLITDKTTEISQTDPFPFPPVPPVSPLLIGVSFDLGPVLPTGLDLASLQSSISSAYYVGMPGTDIHAFALEIVPEPSAVALLSLGLLLSSHRRQVFRRLVD